MSYNGSGVYSLAAGNPVVTGTTISSTWANNTLTDIASGLTLALCKDGQSTPTANIKMGTFKFTGLGAGTIAGDSLRFEQLFSQGNPTDIASAATTDIGAQNTNFLNVTGTTGITSLGTNYNGPKMLKFTGAVTITHNATTLVIPGAANYTTAANTFCIAIPKSTASGTPDGWALIGWEEAANAPGSATTATNIAGGLAGSIPYQSAVNTTALLAAGTAGQLVVSGSAPALTAQGTAGQKLVSAGASSPTWGSSITASTAVASTSGTSIDFTSIPSWVKKITVLFDGVSTNGNAAIWFRLGTGGVPETTGYIAIEGDTFVSTSSASTQTSAFESSGGGATFARYGSATISNITGNSWVCTGMLGNPNTTIYLSSFTGTKTLAGALNMIRVTTGNGTDTFDAGTINILYE